MGQNSLAGIMRTCGKWLTTGASMLSLLYPAEAIHKVSLRKVLNEMRSFDSEFYRAARPFIDPLHRQIYTNYFKGELENIIRFMIDATNYTIFSSDYERMTAMAYYEETGIKASSLSEIPKDFAERCLSSITDHYNKEFEGKIRIPDIKNPPAIPKSRAANFPGIPDDYQPNPGEFVLHVDPEIIDVDPDLAYQYHHALTSAWGHYLDSGACQNDALRMRIIQSSSGMSVLRNAVNMQQSPAENERKKKSIEQKAEMFGYYMLDAIKGWLGNGTTDVIFADRGARPLGIISEYLIGKLKDAKPDVVYPTTHYFKFTSLDKIKQAVLKTGFEGDDTTLERYSRKLIKKAFLEKFGRASDGQKVKVFDEWRASSATFRLTKELLTDCGYDFKDEDFETLVLGEGGGKALIKSGIPLKEVIDDYRKIYFFNNRELERGSPIEYGCDRIKAGYRFSDDTYDDGKKQCRKLITPKHLFSGFDLTKGPHGVKLQKYTLERLTTAEMHDYILDYLVSNHEFISLQSYSSHLDNVPENLDYRKLENMIMGAGGNVTLFRQDMVEINHGIDMIVMQYQDKHDAAKLNSMVGHLVIDWFVKRMKRGVDNMIEQYGAENMVNYLLDEVQSMPVKKGLEAACSGIHLDKGFTKLVDLYHDVPQMA